MPSREPDRQLTIVAPRGYPWAFNGPRQSRHRVRVRNYAPLNKLRSNLDGITIFNPADTAGADLVHAFNRVPLGLKPFVIGFESHLPRVWGLESSGYERFLFANLLARRCRRIVAISQYAARNFQENLATAPISEDARSVLAAKLEIRYPNLNVPADPPAERDLAGEISVTFIGSHFGRKGGCVVARMAELSHGRGLPIRFNVVSSLRVGGPIWTDPSREGFFDHYLSQLRLPNVTHAMSMPNDQVRALLAKSHMCLLPTFADTFGFSVLEAMAGGTPALATAQAALPEIIDDGIDGILLPPAVTPGENGWIWPYDRRDEIQFERLFTDEVERLAAAGLDRLVALLDDPHAYAQMRLAAHRKAQVKFGSEAARAYWDQLYLDCVREGRSDKLPDSDLIVEEQDYGTGIGRL